MSGLQPDVPRVCPGAHGRCLACATSRAERGQPPLPILIGGRRIEALPAGRRLP